MLLFHCLLFVFLWMFLGYDSLPAAEYIIVSGGPAIRFFEKDKTNSHDKYWGNFIDAPILLSKKILPTLKAEDKLTWLVYRPGYKTRGEEMDTDLLAEIQTKAKNAGINLMWFDRSEQLVNYLNRGQNRKQVPIASLDYFGHSNKACFLFDFSCHVDGMSVDYFHVKDLDKIKNNVFAKDAKAKSWGCHSGEYYSQAWKKRFGIPMEGAIGKTDYSRGGLPFLSGKDGKPGSWVQ
jgi:hypothetical protein